MSARMIVKMAVVTGSLTLTVLLSACGGSSVGEIRATGAVTPKALERATAAPTATTDSRQPTATAMPTKTPVPTVAPVATQPPVATDTPVPSRCVPASAGQLERIQAGVKGVAAGNEVKTAWAVKSKDFDEVWMVAALLYGPGMETGAGPGVWAINGTPDSPGLTLAVDGFAKEFSDWLDASKTDAALAGTEDGIAEAKQCAMENK